MKFKLLLHLILTLSLNALENQDSNIVPYDSKQHEVYVVQIAVDNMRYLVSTFAYDSQEEEIEALKAALNSKNLINKVYLLDDKPVAFISYYVKLPFYANLSCYTSFSPIAEICSLAVDKHYQDKGIGSILLRDALNDCKKRSVNKVSLWTTALGSSHYKGKTLGNFYRKFDFKMIRRTKLYEEQFVLKLKPNVARTAALKILHYLRKIK